MLLNSRLTLIITRYASRAHVWTFRRTRGRVGGNLRIGAGFRKPAPTLLLEHQGRKSGKVFVTLLIYITDGPNVIVVASAAGRNEPPEWYLNLLVKPDTHIDIGADHRAVTAVQASADERARLWPGLVQAYADFDSYQSWTDRELPVIILKPRS
jgi:deazaflavin-dependent oxidoreductase (nitroreductase family)